MYPNKVEAHWMNYGKTPQLPKCQMLLVLGFVERMNRRTWTEEAVLILFPFSLCKANTSHSQQLVLVPWITDNKKKSKTCSPALFSTVAWYQGNAFLAAGTSGVFLYVSKSLISFDRIYDLWVHPRREMEENQKRAEKEKFYVGTEIKEGQL